MKLSQVMFAAAALVAATAAQADVARLTGASAQLINVVKALRTSCTTSGGAYKVYLDNSSSTTSLTNVLTAKCTVPFDTLASGSTTDEVRIDVSGGSLFAVLNATAGYGIATPFINPAACTTVSSNGVGTGVLDFLAAGELNKCVGGKTDTTTSDGGLLDVEGPVFNGVVTNGVTVQTDGADFAPTGMSQVFGVAVNTTLYNDLQAFQKTVAGGSIVPSSCVAGDTTAACQPSLSRAQIASLMDSNTSSKAKTLGGAFLGLAAKQVEYCARPQTSGTQQSAQLYFLGQALNGSLGGNLKLANYGYNTGKYAISTNSGAGDVRNCLSATGTVTIATNGTVTTATDTNYRFGVLSAENNPLAQSNVSYRFVKLNEVPFAEGTASTDGQTATATAGRYDFVFESVKYCPAGACAPILDEITAIFTSEAASASPGLFLTGVESKFGRNGNSASPYIVR
jgi:hypothetical protein